MPELEVAGKQASAAPNGSAGRGRLAASTIIGNGRYRVESLLRRGTIGEIYRAVDLTSDHPISLYLFDAGITTDPHANDALRRVLTLTAPIEHKNLIRNGELSIEGSHAFAVLELVEGDSVAELMARKAHAGGVFSPKGAYNILAHVCNALTGAHDAGLAHGILQPECVLVNKAGRVKVIELGFGAVVPVARTHAKTYAAPELAAGGARPSPAADLYSAGAILYQLLTGIPPRPGAQPPSKITLGLPASVDEVVARAVATAPAQRYADTRAFKRAMQQALDGGATVVAPAPTARKRPSLAQQLSNGQQAELQQAGPPANAAAALTDATEKWLISKGKLDYGPFALAQVVDQIRGDQIIPGNVIVDNETGQRWSVEDHPLLSELVEAARQQRDDRRRANAEVEHAKSEKRRGAALYAFIAAGVLALAGGAYAIVGALSSASDDKESASFSALEEAKLEATITFPTKQERQKRSRAARKRRGGGGALGGSGFDQALELGDVSDGEESERLDDTEINPVISRHGGALGRCLTRTGTRSAHVEFIVRGNGRVSDVRVNGKTSGAATSCIGGVMKKMQFPTFNGPRTRAEFDMSF